LSKALWRYLAGRHTGSLPGHLNKLLLLDRRLSGLWLTHGWIARLLPGLWLTHGRLTSWRRHSSLWRLLHVHHRTLSGHLTWRRTILLWPRGSLRYPLRLSSRLWSLLRGKTCRRCL
jgi:hypothetical protein